jgi:hypothetical protein
MKHYHPVGPESFGSRGEAEAIAKQVVRTDETYLIEERDKPCPECRAGFKTSHATRDADSKPKLKYPWQQAVVDASNECRLEFLPLQMNAARRALSIRLCEPTPFDWDEQIATRHALLSLRCYSQD